MTFQRQTANITDDKRRLGMSQLFPAVYTITSTTKQRTHAHSVFAWVFPARLSHIRHQSELTKREKENAIQRLGKASIWVTSSVRWGDQKISHNSIKYYFKRSDQADCSFSVRTWKSFRVQEISKIYFFKAHRLDPFYGYYLLKLMLIR